MGVFLNGGFGIVSLDGGLSLILGGIRSGKSERAELLARLSCSDSVIWYLATMRESSADSAGLSRILDHRRRREDDSLFRWEVIECPVDLGSAIRSVSGSSRTIVVEDLATWLTNLLVEEVDIELALESALSAMLESSGTRIVVSSEVGVGGLGVTSLSRRFQDLCGEMNCRAAEISDRVEMIFSGLPLVLKGVAV